jgi:formylglycine-generating enzyme required for sulfatase activity
LITIPAGAFTLGSDDGQPDERPMRRVWVGAFELAAQPVTNRDYLQFVEATGRARPPALDDPGFAHPLQPVVAVNWFDAVAFCEWLCSITGRRCRLPTEAEREKAARGAVDGARFACAADARRAECPSPLATLPEVTRDDPNGYGLFHMGDLVHEWCSDWYGADYYRHPSSPNPSGPSVGTRRCSRGGSWRHRVPVTRCAARSSIPPDRTYSDYGFRVAVGVPY